MPYAILRLSGILGPSWSKSSLVLNRNFPIVVDLVMDKSALSKRSMRHVAGPFVYLTSRSDQESGSAGTSGVVISACCPKRRSFWNNILHPIDFRAPRRPLLDFHSFAKLASVGAEKLSFWNGIHHRPYDFTTGETFSICRISFALHALKPD